MSMSPAEMKDIRIPSALMRERRPSVLFTIVKSTFAAVLLAVIAFFCLNALAIAVLAIVSVFRHERLDFSMAYRNFAAPAAMGIFLLAWVGALIFFFRERGR
jgi:hypothetical protein